MSIVSNTVVGLHKVGSARHVGRLLHAANELVEVVVVHARHRAVHHAGNAIEHHPDHIQFSNYMRR